MVRYSFVPTVSVPPLTLRKRPWFTLVTWHSSTNIFSLGRGRVFIIFRYCLTRHFLNKQSLSYNVYVSIKKVKRADVIFPQKMNSHKSGQPKSKNFCDRQDNFNVERQLTFTKIDFVSSYSCFSRTNTNIKEYTKHQVCLINCIFYFTGAKNIHAIKALCTCSGKNIYLNDIENLHEVAEI